MYSMKYIKNEDLDPLGVYLDSQVAGNNRPLYPKVDHYWFKAAHNYEPLALQVGLIGKIWLPLPRLSWLI